MFAESTSKFGDKVICNPPIKLRKNEKYPQIDIEKITPGIKYVTSEERIEYVGQGGAKFEDHDVLMARITPCLENGKIAIAYTDGENGIGSTELFVFRGMEGISDTDYIYYLLNMPFMRQQAVNSMTGASGRQRADLEFIKKIRWNFPDIENQRKIGSILSNYDSLIETNNKRIKILEQMAENLYKEWFVRFRFPGYEKVDFENGRLGKIPKSFCVLKMQDVFEYYVGGGWGNDDETAEFSKAAYVIRGTDFPAVERGDIKSCPFRYHKPSNFNARKLEAEDIILEVSGGTAEQPVGRTVFIDKSLVERFGGNVICASFCKQIRIKKDIISPVYFYYWMQFLYNTRIIDRFQLQSTGIINFKFEYFLKNGDVMLPTQELMKSFEKNIQILRSEIMTLAMQNENLIKQRDLLLPRLMSGKLEVR